MVVAFRKRTPGTAALPRALLDDGGGRHVRLEQAGMGLACERPRRFPADRHRTVLRSCLRDYCLMPSNHGGGTGSLAGLVPVSF